MSSVMTCRDCGLCESWQWKRIMWAWLPARITFLFCQSFHTCQVGWTRALVTRARRQLCVRSTNCSSICLYLLLFLLTVLQYYRDAERQYQHTGRLLLTTLCTFDHCALPFQCSNLYEDSETLMWWGKWGGITSECYSVLLAILQLCYCECIRFTSSASRCIRDSKQSKPL